MPIDFTAPFNNALRGYVDTARIGYDVRRDQEEQRRKDEESMQRREYQQMLMDEATRRRQASDVEGQAYVDASKPVDNPLHKSYFDKLSVGPPPADPGPVPSPTINPSMIEVSARAARGMMQNPQTAARGQELFQSSLDQIGDMIKNGGGAEAVTLYNRIAGTDFKYQGKEGKRHIIENAAGGELLMIDEGILDQTGSLAQATQKIPMNKPPEKSSGSGFGDGTADFTDQQIDYMADMYNLRGTLPALGMGKSALRTAILQRAADRAAGRGADANKVVSEQGEVKGLTQSLGFQEKQLGMMRSFVDNLKYQVDRVEEIGKDIASFDTRLLNVPLRLVRGRIAGSANQAKYDMYITEIESEIGKLATGSTASIAELSQGAQERWAKIHDKNLSIADMLSLLKETANAGDMRFKSVQNAAEETRRRLSQVGKDQQAGPAQIQIRTTADYDKLPSGAEYVDPNGVTRRKK